MVRVVFRDLVRCVRLETMSKLKKLIFFKTKEEKDYFLKKVKELSKYIQFVDSDLVNYEFETPYEEVRLCLLHSFYTCGITPSKIIFYNCCLDDCEDEEAKITLKMFENISLTRYA